MRLNGPDLITVIIISLFIGLTFNVFCHLRAKYTLDLAQNSKQKNLAKNVLILLKNRNCFYYFQFKMKPENRTPSQLASDIEACIEAIAKRTTKPISNRHIIRQECRRFKLDFNNLCKIAGWESLILLPPNL